MKWSRPAVRPDDAHHATRVMHVVYALRAGGMEHGVVKLVNGLDPERVRSAVCSTAPAGDLKHLLGADVPLFELRRRQGNDPKLVWELYRLFSAEHPDIIHTHAWGTLIEGLLAARLARVPVVIHGEHGTLQLRGYQRWLQRRAWAAADHVLSVSSRLADRITHETRFPRERIRVIRNGVDLSRFGHVGREQARAAIDIATSGPLIVTVGRLVPVKDQATLIEAVALLHREGVEATLAIAGDGPLHDTLSTRAATLGVAGQVRFLGYRKDVENVLGAADVFVLSSESEGMSNTILEAMASRLPVVATRVGGADEMVVDGVTGHLVPARAPGDLARALAPLLRDRTRRQAFGTAARARVEAEFTIDSMLRNYEALYIDAMRGTSRQPARRSAGAGAASSGAM